MRNRYVDNSNVRIEGMHVAAEMNGHAPSVCLFGPRFRMQSVTMSGQSTLIGVLEITGTPQSSYLREELGMSPDSD